MCVWGGTKKGPVYPTAQARWHLGSSDCQGLGEVAPSSPPDPGPVAVTSASGKQGAGLGVLLGGCVSQWVVTDSCPLPLLLEHGKQVARPGNAQPRGEKPQLPLFLQGTFWRDFGAASLLGRMRHFLETLLATSSISQISSACQSGAAIA